MNVVTAFRSEPRVGQQDSGDACVVRREGDQTLLAVIDALGHGPVAAQVAEAAVSVVQNASLSDDPGELLQRVGQALHGSRGAAATICIISGGDIAGCGVGNVYVRFRGGAVSPFLNDGVLGGRVREFRSFAGKLRAGLRLAMYSDGIRATFRIPSPMDTPVDEACQSIYDEFRVTTDDATLLIADTTGP